MTCTRVTVTVERQCDTTESAILVPGESANFASNEVNRFMNASDSEKAIIILVIDSTRLCKPMGLSGLVGR